MKNVAILGSTGSIGLSTLAVIDTFPDKLQVSSLACGNNQEMLCSQIERYKPLAISVSTEPRPKLREVCRKHSVEISHGQEGLISLATMRETDIILAGMSGSQGMIPVSKALEVGKSVALANKETLVMAGQFITSQARMHQATILPVDSEHNAIFQCLNGEETENIERVILCASGGPFRKTALEDFENITVEAALNHPRWKMGPKITIDSATLMNKGLEMIEARWLFNLPPKKVDVLVHPQSLAHSMVEFVDGSIIAQIGIADMQMPIQNCLSYPQRWPNKSKKLSLHEAEAFIFEKPDYDKFPSLNLAKIAMEEGKTLPAVLNAADEEAVLAFLNKKINFTSIMEVVEKIMHGHKNIDASSLEEIIEVDRITREKARALIDRIS